MTHSCVNLSDNQNLNNNNNDVGKNIDNDGRNIDGNKDENNVNNTDNHNKINDHSNGNIPVYDGVHLLDDINRRLSVVIPHKLKIEPKHKSFSVNRNKQVNDEREMLQYKRYTSLPSVRDNNTLPSWMTLCRGGSNELIHEEDEENENEESSQSNENISQNNMQLLSPTSISVKVTELQKLQFQFEKLKEKLSLLETLVQENVLTNNSVDEAAKVSAQQKINSERVFINIGGIRHETYRSTLKNIPDTRLSWIAEESATHSPDYDPVNKEFFFDRHPQVFSHILNYYRTGNMHVPYDVCGPLFEEELQYWGMDDTQVESCCWTTYRQHRDAQETLKEFEGIEFERDYDEDSEPDLEKYGFERHDSGEIEKISFYQKWQPTIWKLMEDPHSSKKAKVVAYISMTLILLSVVLFCMETIQYFREEQRKFVLFLVECSFVSYFTIELVVRFIFCPDWRLFMKSPLNWIDFLAIVTFTVTTIMIYGFRTRTFLEILQGIRVIRVFRIIKLAKHSVGLQILGHTLKASFHELLLLIFFLVIGIIIFSSLVYYCEYNEPGTKFYNIPATFWWAVVTMTTVGYGDMVPETIAGKIIGSFCSICGVLMIALPVPVIVNNFNLYYSHAQARLKLPKKKRRVLCGASNALKGPALEEYGRREYPNSPELTTQEEQDSNKSEDESLDKEKQNEDRIVQLRMKRFSRRDSNMFAAGTATGGWGNGTTTDSPITVKRNNYAMNKRRSLLPTIATLPESEH